MLIAVIDDEAMICELVVETFADVGAEVHCATNGVDGEQLLAAGMFDLAIIDAQLPGKSGIGLIEIATNRDIPVMMMSGHPDAFEKLPKFSVPNILKPFSMRKLQDEGMRIIADKNENVRRAKEAVAAMQAR